MGTLYLIRHGETQIDPASPAATWPLSEGGRAAAVALASQGNFADVDAWYSSPEPKAIETAEALGAGDVRIDAGLTEASRPGWSDDYLGDVTTFFSSRQTPVRPGWETADAASARFVDCVVEICRRSDERITAVVCHGLVLSLFAAHMSPTTDAISFWRELRFLDCFRFSADDIVAHHGRGTSVPLTRLDRSVSE